MALSLGNDPSEFRCLPEELIERMGRFPDAYGQLEEIILWYGGRAREREERRILELADRVRPRDGQKVDPRAIAELNDLVNPRAGKAGVRPDQYIERLKAKHGRIESDNSRVTGHRDSHAGRPADGARVGGRPRPGAPRAG